MFLWSPYILQIHNLQICYDVRQITANTLLNKKLQNLQPLQGDYADNKIIEKKMI